MKKEERVKKRRKNGKSQPGKKWTTNNKKNREKRKINIYKWSWKTRERERERERERGKKYTEKKQFFWHWDVRNKQ